MTDLKCNYKYCKVTVPKPVFGTPGDGTMHMHEECYYDALARQGTPFTPPLISRTDEMEMQPIWSAHYAATA